MARRVRALLEPSQFTRWLHEAVDDRHLFCPGECARCPLAVYLQSRLGLEKFEPDVIEVTTDVFYRGRYLLGLPNWAVRFVLKLDGDFVERGPDAVALSAAGLRRWIAASPLASELGRA